MNTAAPSPHIDSGFNQPGEHIRLVSPGAALLGGLLSIAGCLLFHYRFRIPGSLDISEGTTWFMTVWSSMLTLTVAANIALIVRNARRRSGGLISSRLKLAVCLILPAFLCGVYFTATAFHLQGPYLFVPFLRPPVWMMCYGVGLLSTQPLAPRSIILLGWSFLLAGFLSYLYLGVISDTHPVRFYYISNALMGATFGVFHLIYVACIWLRRTSGGDALVTDKPVLNP